MKTFILCFVLILTSSASLAEIKTYESTDNTGLNKKERIDTVESYLSTMSTSLQKMESKLDDNAKKIMALDQMIKEVQQKEMKRELQEKEAQGKKVAKKTDSKGEEKTIEGEKSAEKSEDYIDLKVGEKTQKSEIDKLKADVLAIKNQDIEKLKTNLEELSDTVKALQATIKR